MLNLNFAQAQNSYNNRMQCANVSQGHNSNPMMMMAMTMMTACLMEMMSQMGLNGGGMCPMNNNGGFGNPNGHGQDSCSINDFLGGNGNNSRGCSSGYDNGYNGGYSNFNNGTTGGRDNFNNSNGNYDRGSDNSSTGNSNSTGKTSGVGKDLPQGVDGISYSKACQMVKDAGGQLNPDGKPTVLAIRSANTTSRSYQDAFLVLKPDGTMEKFSANTRPTSKGKDKAMLKNGEYNIKPRWQDGKWKDAFIVGSSHSNNNVNVSRDSNGDGQYNDSELNTSNKCNTIRLHRGNKNGNTSSAGCLNVKDYDGFLDAVGGRKSEFNLVLVTM